MTRTIDTAEQAKMIRKDLKTVFPATPFKVTIRRYAGGSSVTVRWQDGPTTADVSRMVTSYYDGRGVADASDYWPHRILRINGEDVSFGGSISLDRSYSVPFYTRQMQMLCATYGVDPVPVEETCGHAYAPNAWFVRIGPTDLQTLMHQKLWKTRAADCKIVGTPDRPAIEAVREV